MVFISFDYDIFIIATWGEPRCTGKPGCQMIKIHYG